MLPSRRSRFAAFVLPIRRVATAAVALIALALGPSQAGFAQPATATATLFENVRIFDGKSARLSGPSNVLVRGNVIERISTSAIAPEPGTRVIDGGGRTLMPGLIDAHWHM